jgi:hypothetical protein
VFVLDLLSINLWHELYWDQNFVALLLFYICWWWACFFWLSPRLFYLLYHCHIWSYSTSACCKILTCLANLSWLFGLQSFCLDGGRYISCIFTSSMCLDMLCLYSVLDWIFPKQLLESNNLFWQAFFLYSLLAYLATI